SYRDSELIAGIDTAVRRGRSVINMSWDGTRDDPLLDDELLLAFGTGSVLVAAAGNEFDEGNPIEFPASLNHVLTVASTDQASCPRTWLRRSLALATAEPPSQRDWTTRRTRRTCTASGCRLIARSPFGSRATPTSTSSCGRPGPPASTSGERHRSAT